MFIVFCVLLSLTFAHGINAGCSISSSSICKCDHQVVIKYNSATVSCGMKLDKAKATKAPTVTLSAAISGKSYLILMVDPDAPGSGTGNAWAHWIAETTGSELKKGNIMKTHLEYAGPTPPSGTGDHHYLFVILEYNKKSIGEVTERGRFPYVDFISSHGSLVATNMFKASA